MERAKAEKPGNRYRFNSFKDRVDAIKIEPYRKLHRRAFDETDTSHFLASFERWKEINRSATFTDFVENVETVSQSLPQIIHYKGKIFTELKTHLLKHDHLSLEPLLELLTQLCHDLGPDFIEFYPESLEILVNLSLSDNNADMLEWEFNCLAYIFKYLSRYICKDVRTTLQSLTPILREKSVVARFASEALSFLIRKCQELEVNDAIDYIFENLNDDNFYKSAVVLLSDSMKSTKGIVHSKSSVLIDLLFKKVSSIESFALLSDILLNVINYGNADSVSDTYLFVLKKFHKFTERNFDDEAVQVGLLRILLSLVFADSGKKVPDWDVLSKAMTRLLNLMGNGLSQISSNMVVALLITYFRNTPTGTLTKYHSTILQFSTTLDHSFLPFLMGFLETSPSRAVTYAPPFFQVFLNTNWNKHAEQLSLFLAKLENMEPSHLEKFRFRLPPEMEEYLYHQLELFDEDSPCEIYWKLSLLSNFKAHKAKPLLHLLGKIKCSIIKAEDKAVLVSTVIKLLSSGESDLNDLVLENLEDLHRNLNFIRAISNISQKVTRVDFSLSEKERIIDVLSLNLLSPVHEIRLSSLNTLFLLSRDIDSIGDLINQCSTIEEIPLEFSTARDIGIRMRNLTKLFNTISSPLADKIYVRFMFGLLTTKFSPSWTAVFESLEETHLKVADLVWEYCLNFLLRVYEKPVKRVELRDELFKDFVSTDERLKTSIFRSVEIVQEITDYKTSLKLLMDNEIIEWVYEDQMRASVLIILKKIPSLAERNAQYLVPLILDQDENSEEEQRGDSSIHGRDRILVLQLFSQFRNLKSVTRATEFREKCLELLSAKTSGIRNAALDCLLNLKDKTLNKYKDALKNLLDDGLFRDEISKLVTKEGQSPIENDDKEKIMPLILRIVFARTQSTSSVASKKGLKFAALSSLANIDKEQLVYFLDIASEKIMRKKLNSESISGADMRISHGFFNMMLDVVSSVGEQSSDAIQTIIPCVIESLIACQEAIDGNDDVQIVSLARSSRQSGMKLLSSLFIILHEYDWDHYIISIYEKILSPRFESFENENLQQVSSLLTLIVTWADFPSYHELLLINDFEPIRKVMCLISNMNAKEEVILKVIEFANHLINSLHSKKRYVAALQYITSVIVQSSGDVILKISDRSFVDRLVELLLSISERKLIKDTNQKKKLIELLTRILDKPAGAISKVCRTHILQTLKVLISNFEGSFDQLKDIYCVCSKYLKLIEDKDEREILISIFSELGDRFEDFSNISHLLKNLHAYSHQRMLEYDYDKRLNAFKQINEIYYSQFTELEWLPLLNTCLFFIHRADDMAIRSNASFTLRRFIDAFSEKRAPDSALLQLFKSLILVNLRLGLRSSNDEIRAEFVNLLSYIISDGNYVDNFKDMQILFQGSEESNFFSNINHVQIHRRQRALRRLTDLLSEISSSNISHYLLPIAESYVFYDDEKMANLSSDAIFAIESLVSHLTYKQYQAIFKRYMLGLKENNEKLRSSINLIVTVCKALKNNIVSHDEKMSGLPSDKDELDEFIEKKMVEPIRSFLLKRNENTMVYKTSLIEALSCLCVCLSHEHLVSVLPGTLTGVCQILRTRSDELRDATRKNLAKAAALLGPNYIKFIISELKTALTKGSQVHILGFTVHYILTSMTLKHGDLDESAHLIVDIVMENIFGATGQEKDNEGYRTTMKEIKSNKGFDTAEILSRVISLTHFYEIINPVKLLAQEHTTLKIQNKMEELAKRYISGMNKNDEISSKNMLVLCYQLFHESENKGIRKDERKNTTLKDQHFLVQLNSKIHRVETQSMLFTVTLQKFALELLRLTLSHNESFISQEHLTGFLSIFQEVLKSDNELVLISALRVLGMILRVNFDTDIDIFKNSSRKCLQIIKGFPSTDSELSQAAYKYLSLGLQQKDDLMLKESAIGYLLVRIIPDIQEQNKQGLAFNFIKAVVSNHVLIPEVYDIMDTVRDIMVTSPSKERRDTSRSIYFKFLMEYDQSKGRLENQFKFLVNNLSYPAESGKQSVMELLHLIISKSSPALLRTVGSSFFVGLSKVLISDTTARTREMAVSLIGSLFKNLGTTEFEKYINGWISSKNSSLVSCSLQLYRIKLKETENHGEIEDKVLEIIKEVLGHSKVDSSESVKWEVLYNALQTLSEIEERNPATLDIGLRSDIVNCLLYPHSWVRLAAGRLCCNMLSKNSLLSNEEIQNIAYRLLHQLRAPIVEEGLGKQIVKGLIISISTLEKADFKVHLSKLENENENSGKRAEEVSSEDVLKFGSWVIKRASAIARLWETTISSKRACIQLFALLAEMFNTERIEEDLNDMLLPLINITELKADTDEMVDLQNSALQCMKVIENKIGITKYTLEYSSVVQFIQQRRQDRKKKRSILTITAPEAVARRKNKKHQKTREKRKHEKDDNGFYHTKKKRN